MAKYKVNLDDFDQSEMVIRYKRKDDNSPVGVVVALSPTEIGWAMCSKKDCFSKNLGKTIAIGRALHSSRSQKVPQSLQSTYEWVENIVTRRFEEDAALYTEEEPISNWF